MPVPHSIRLRGPWEFQPLARLKASADGSLLETADHLPPGGTLALPADWASKLGPDFWGRVRFSRVFHRPTGLDASSKVWLVVEDVDWCAHVVFNERALGDVVCRLADAPQAAGDTQRSPARWDITDRLQPENRLSVDVTCPGINANGRALPRVGRGDASGGLIGPVRLEIE
jgi:hypothetical protein